MTLRYRLALALCALLGLQQPVSAHYHQVGEIVIAHPYAHATPPGAPVAGVYFTLVNQGKSADRLLRATTPVAGQATLHIMKHEGDVMRMREVGTMALKPGASVKLAPGAAHVMLMDLKQPLKEGARFPMTLNFERAGKIEIDVMVESATKQMPHQH